MEGAPGLSELVMMGTFAMKETHSKAYATIERLFADDTCVILDGGVSTEMQRAGLKGYQLDDPGLWGTWGLYHAPQAVLDVHRSFVSAGCDLISTNTWAILDAPQLEARVTTTGSPVPHWMDVARLGVRLARQAIHESASPNSHAVAFTINGDVTSSEQLETLRLLLRVLAENPPDLIFLETMSLIREELTLPAVQIMLDSGFPVWLSFRRCRDGVCGIHGQHWGGPEGDSFGRAAREFEAIGVGALLINCLPTEHVPGMLPWLRDFTDLPLGIYPNLGRYADPGWKFDDTIGPDEYAELASVWRDEGAQIVGGCCGVSPEHLAAARQRLAGSRPGKPSKSRSHALAAPLYQHTPSPKQGAVAVPWVDQSGRGLFPLQFPEIICDSAVFHPTQGSFLLWKELYTSTVGRGLQCLDIGCGSGILAVQLALNGAARVDAFDIQREAVANTMANAFRNGVADRVRGNVVDLYTYQPESLYDVVVASLYQMPVDPHAETSSHRPADYWGRNLLDHLIGILPAMLAPDGRAFIMQISVLGQLRTADLLAQEGLESRVLDFSFFPFSSVFQENREQILRVEQLSDAYHLTLGGEDIMVMYLLELTHVD